MSQSKSTSSSLVFSPLKENNRCLRVTLNLFLDEFMYSLSPLGGHLIYSGVGKGSVFLVRRRSIRKLDKPGDRCKGSETIESWQQCIKKAIQKQRACVLPMEKDYNNGL